MRRCAGAILHHEPTFLAQHFRQAACQGGALLAGGLEQRELDRGRPGIEGDDVVRHARFTALSPVACQCAYSAVTAQENRH